MCSSDLHTDTEVTKDIEYVREVQKDYAGSHALGHDEKVEQWKAVGDELEIEKASALSVAYDIQQQVDHGLQVLLVTQSDLHALGQQYL